MKLFDVLVAFASLSLLLLIGMALRQRLRWLRQLGIPEALVAGLLGLLVGPFGPFPNACVNADGVCIGCLFLVGIRL